MSFPAVRDCRCAIHSLANTHDPKNHLQADRKQLSVPAKYVFKDVLQWDSFHLKWERRAPPHYPDANNYPAAKIVEIIRNPSSRNERCV